jgi:CRISPR-associated protein Csm2
MGNQQGGNKPAQGGQPTQHQEKPEHLDLIPGWIHNGITAETVEKAEIWGKKLVDKKFTSSQIRNVFGEIRRIEAKRYKEETTSFLLLKPKMAYAYGRFRQKNERDAEGVGYFKQILDKAHEAVVKDTTNVDLQSERFGRFVQLMEAILAYHKASGGKD